MTADEQLGPTEQPAPTEQPKVTGPQTEDAIALSPKEFEKITKDKVKSGKKEPTIEEKIKKQEDALAKKREEYYDKIQAETKRLGKVEIVETKKATYLLTELPFFKIELQILGLITMLSAGIILATILKLVDPVMNLAAFAIIILTVWTIWLIKKILYMPNKSRFPTLKIFSSGLATLVCEKITDRKVWFNQNIAPSVITNYRAMTDMFTGYPLIVAFEGHFENLDLPGMMKGKADLNKSERLKATLDEAVEQGVRKERIKQKTAKKTEMFRNPLFWITIATLALLAFYVFNVATPQGKVMQGMKETLDSINTNITTMSEALITDNPPDPNNAPPDNVIVTPGGS